MTAADHRAFEGRRRTRPELEARLAPIVQKHKDLLVDYLFQMTGMKDRAIEISLQTAAMLGRSKVPVTTDPRLWLLKEATGRILRQERADRVVRLFAPWTRRRPRRPVFEQGITPGAGVAAWERAEQERVVREALAAVKPKLRRLLVLRDIMGLPDDEVAQLSGLTSPELRARLDRARLAFREAISRIGED